MKRLSGGIDIGSEHHHIIVHTVNRAKRIIKKVRDEGGKLFWFDNPFFMKHNNNQPCA